MNPLTTRPTLRCLVMAGLLAAAGLAQAQGQPQPQAQPATGQQALYVKALAATCANCHGTQGRAAEGSSVASLAGLGQAYIVAQMKAFASGTRPATVMHQLSKGYTDAQIDQIAGYFAVQKK